MTRKLVGYLVCFYEECEGLRFPQGLEFPENAPRDGVLGCIGRTIPAATIFATRKDARRALTRTFHYNRLWYPNNPDSPSDYRLVPVRQAD